MEPALATNSGGWFLNFSHNRILVILEVILMEFIDSINIVSEMTINDDDVAI